MQKWVLTPNHKLLRTIKRLTGMQILSTPRTREVIGFRNRWLLSTIWRVSTSTRTVPEGMLSSAPSMVLLSMKKRNVAAITMQRMPWIQV